jgi:hypothetical protein
MKLEMMTESDVELRVREETEVPAAQGDPRWIKTRSGG